MADDKKKPDSMGKTLAKSGVVMGLVAAPAFGGQVLSAMAKAKIDAVGDMAESGLGEVIVDGVASAAVAAVEIGIAAAIGGKKGAMKAAPFAIGGALMGALLPALDRGIDGIVDGMIGDSSSSTTEKKLPGGAPELGYQLPGGAPELGDELPGGASYAETRGNPAY